MALLRFEVHADAARADDAAAVLAAWPHAINVTRLRAAALDPPGDVLSCDVPREAADRLLDRLHQAGLCDDRASVAIISGTAHVSERADRAERAARGSASDAFVWRLVRDTLDEEVELSATFLAFMVLATLLGTIGVVTDSAILVVGAMVIGPEFGPLASLCAALLHRDLRQAGRGVVTLIAGFAVAITAAVGLTVALRATGVFPTDLVFSGLVREVASPGWISLVIALIAGSAGVLSLTSARSGSLIGVLISVTTIPAAADAAALASYGRPREAFGSLLTLGINLAGLAVAAVVTLAMLHALNRRATAASTSVTAMRE